MDIAETMPQVVLNSTLSKTQQQQMPPAGVVNNSSKLKENARRTLKLSIPKMQMAEQQRAEVKQPRIVNGGETIIQGDATGIFLNASTPPQVVKTVSPCSGTNRSPMLNRFMEENPKQFNRFMSFSPGACNRMPGKLLDSRELVSGGSEKYLTVGTPGRTGAFTFE